MADYIPVFLDWARSTEGLNDAEKGRLIDAMVAYANGEDWQNLLKGNERFVMNVFRGMIDRHIEKVDANRINGNRGGRPKKTSGFDEKPNCEVGFDEKPNCKVGFDEKPNYKVGFDEKPEKEKEKDKDKNKDKEDVGITRARVRFIPPTPDDVREYCREKGYAINAEYFVDYYQRSGWKLKNGPMVDWKAAVRTWVQNDYRKGGVTDGDGGKPAEERDLFAGFSAEDLAEIDRLANDGEHFG